MRNGILLIAATLVASYACGDSNAPKPSPLARLTIVSGDSQSGAAGTALSAPIVLQAFDSNGHAAVGVNAIFGPEGNGKISPASVVTDNSGKASITWTLATTPGLQNLLATVTQGTAIVITDTVWATAH